jgi:heme A synthase
LIDSDLHPWLQSVRLALAILGLALVVATAVHAVRVERLRRWGAAIATLLVAEMILGLVIRTGDLAPAVASVYSVIAVGLLWSLGLLTAFAWRSQIAGEATPVESEPSLV